MKEKTKSRRSKRTCFISASPNAPIGELTSILRSLGVKPVVASDFSRAGSKPSDVIADAISKSDLVIAVLSDTSSNANVFFEMGYAHALQKPLLIQAGEGAKEIPSDLRGFLYVRTGETESNEPLRFAIQQWISAPSTITGRKSFPDRRSKAIGNKSDELLQKLDSLGPGYDHASVEAVVQESLQASGISASAYAQSGAPHQGVDLAVWVDDVSSLVGNPVVIEIKAGLRTVQDARAVRDQLLGYLATTNSQTGVVLYVNGPASDVLNQSAGLPNLFFIQVRELLERLRTQGFGAVVAESRNKLVHGGAY